MEGGAPDGPAENIRSPRISPIPELVSVSDVTRTALTPAAKLHRHGTHRTVPPSETLTRIAPFMARAGITRVANLTGLDRVGIPVYSVCRPNARSICVAQGKGLTPEEAKASGIMEAMEYFHAEHTSLALRLASVEELRAASLHPLIDGLPRVDALPLDGDTPLLWTEARALETGSSFHVPYELVHTDYRLPLPTGSGRFLMSSNGLASGNDRREALCHAICELIERDATTLFRVSGRKRAQARRVRLDSIEDEGCREALDRFEAAGVAVVVWETTTDVNVPAFLCEVADCDARSARPLGPRRGMGCHTERGIALARALTEAAQTRLTVISGARDDLGVRLYDDAAEERRRQEFLKLWRDERQTRDFAQAPSHNTASFDADLEFLSSRLRVVTEEPILTVDLTRAGWPIAVVRALVPGLEPMYEAPGFLPGERARRERRRWNS